MKFTTIYDEHEIQILEKKRKDFESNIDAQRTIDIYRQLCCEDEPIDDESRNSKLLQVFQIQTSEELYRYPNAAEDLRIAKLKN